VSSPDIDRLRNIEGINGLIYTLRRALEGTPVRRDTSTAKPSKANQLNTAEGLQRL
jgi:hypothetical protein